MKRDLSLHVFTSISPVSLCGGLVTFGGELQMTLYKREEDEMIELYREMGHELLNKRRACDSKEARREYMRNWRLAHGQGGDGESYMARKSREFRERHHQMAIEG